MRPVVLDVDTGVDDALALLLAARHPQLDLLAVTCVGGNARVDDVVLNTLTVLQACDRGDVPVARGAARPLLERAGQPRLTHGTDGMGDLGWPAPDLSPDPRHAVELLRDSLCDAASAGRPLTLVTLGPLTNVALLLRTWPHATAGLRDVVIMGGAFGVDEDTAATEFNIRHDPEAAAIVLDATGAMGIPVTMYGLDVFFAPTVTRAQARELVDAGGHGPTELAGRLAAFQCARLGADAATIGDAGAVCAVLDPAGLIKVEEVPIRVALTGRRGQTTSGPSAQAGDPTSRANPPSDPTVRVARQVDGPRYAGLWLDAVR